MEEDNLMMGQNNVVVEQKPSIKLIKTSKSYNWEIRILGNDIDELERMNNKMLIKFLGDSKDE